MEHHCKGLEAVQLFFQEAMGGGGVKREQTANKQKKHIMYAFDLSIFF